MKPNAICLGLPLVALLSIAALTTTAFAQTVRFAAPVSYALREDPESICAGDLDGDGDHDLAISSDGRAGIVLLANDGTGVMTTLGQIPTTAEIKRLICGDVDGDGDKDIVAANGEANSITVFLNDGTGRFPTKQTIGVSGRDVTSVTFIDFDKDGRLDLATANRDSQNVGLFRNTGSGFSAAGSLVLLGRAEDIVSADVDHDGWPDLVLPDESRDGVVWLRNGGGLFGAANLVGTGNSSSPETVLAADLDGDGDLELIAGSDNQPGLVIVTNGGGGRFGATTRVATTTAPDRIIGADLDGDSDVDLAVVGENANVVDVLLNDGTGRFTRITTPTGGGPHDLVAIDLDGDGDLDLATPDENGNSASVVRNLTTGATPIATLRPLGAIATGTTTALLVNSPHDGAAAYVVAYSTALSPQIPLPGGRKFPLGPSPLLMLSLESPAPIFNDTTGRTSSSGSAYTRVVIPNLSALKGTKLHGAFALIDPLHPGGFGTVSAARTLTIR